MKMHRGKHNKINYLGCPTQPCIVDPSNAICPLSNLICPSCPTCPISPFPDIIVPSGITFLTPIQGPTIGGNSIIINGYNLIYTKYVTVGIVNVSFTILSNNEIQIVLPANPAQIVNINVQFQNDSSESLPYTYIDNASITSLNPSSGPMAGSNIITITGSGLSSTVSVYFNNIITYSFVVTSDSTLQVAVPNVTNQSNIQVHVVTAAGVSNTLSYTIVPPPII